MILPINSGGALIALTAVLLRHIHNYTTRTGKKTYLRNNCIIAVIYAALASEFAYIPYFARMLSAFSTAGW